MAEIDEVKLIIKAELTQYKNALKATTTIVDGSLKRQEDRIISLERQIERSSGAIAGKLRLLAGTFAGAFSVREIGGLIDGFTRLQNSLRVSGLEGAELEAVQARLLEMSGRYGVSIGALADLFGNATLAGKELGASQAQLLNLTEAVSQALLITGRSSAQASGAILGLQQALGGGTVRAEEYNQIIEGGLQPLLQAAANSDRFGGSLAKLRKAVTDGTVSSKELLDTILQFSDGLKSQASNATLTLSGALEALNSRLTVYVGQSAQANGASAALAGGIKLLADNLDTMANVVAIVAAALIGRFAGGAITASLASARLAVTTAGATTAMGALGVAAGRTGTALLAAFGGAPGLAITALVVVIGLAINKASEFERTLKSQQAGQDAARKSTERLREATDRLATATGKARVEALAQARALQASTRQKLAAAAASLRLAQAEAKAAQTRLFAADAEARERDFRSGGRFALAPGFGGSQSERRDYEASRQEQARLLGLVKGLTEDINAANAAITAGPPGVGGGGGGMTDAERKKAEAERKKAEREAAAAAKRDAREAEQFADTQASFRDDVRRAQAERLQDELQVTNNLDRRAEIMAELDQLEFDSRLEAINNNRDYSREQKQQLEAELRKRFALFGSKTGPDGEVVVTANESDLTRARAKQIANERYAIEQNALRSEIDTAIASADLLTGRRARLEAEKRILRLTEEAERKALDQDILDGRVLDAKKAGAELASRQASRRESVDRQFESPLQRYRREVEEGTSNIGDAYEEIAIDGVRTLNSELANTVKNVLGLNGALGNTVAKLIEIALQKGAFDLLGSLFGGGKASASDTAVSSALSIANQFIPGRASGGYAGSLVRVNEGASPGRVEGFMPNGGGQIIPLGRMNAMSPQQAGGGTSTIRLELSGDIDARMKSVAAGVSIEVVRTAAPMIREQAAKDVASMNRPRI